MKNKKIIVFSNTSWSLYNFRKELLEKLSESNKLYLVAPKDAYTEKLRFISNNIVLLNFSRFSVNPFHDFYLFLRFIFLVNKLQPDLVLNFTIKPVIYGALTCRLLNINCINTITGLGRVFYPIWEDNFLRNIVIILYRISQKKVSKVFFQNLDDLNYFVDRKIINNERTIRVFGSGVNVNKFKPKLNNIKKKNIVFLMVSRLIYQKGVMDFIKSSKIISKKYSNIKFILIGEIEKGINSIPFYLIKDNLSENFEYIPFNENIVDFYNKADCIVLPSYYREGIPKVLLEASACGKPILTTNNIGCIDVIEDGYNGFLCEPNDHIDLGKKMAKFIELSDSDRAKFGARSRKLSLQKYDVRKIVQMYIESIDSVLVK